MKRHKIYLLIPFLILFSCKKTWQCECTQVNNWETSNSIVTNVAIEDKKKDDAKAICSSLGYDMGSGNYKGCKIKN